MVSFLDSTGTQHLITKMLDTVYPIGSIYISTSNVSPASFIGGTWEKYASGRTIVGIDSTDTDFSTVNKTGGTKTTIHQHKYGIMAGDYYGLTSIAKASVTGGGSPWTGAVSFNDAGNIIDGFGQGQQYFEQKPVYVPINASTSGAKIVNSARYASVTQTSKQTVSSLPPYIVSYVWRRVL